MTAPRATPSGSESYSCIALPALWSVTVWVIQGPFYGLAMEAIAKGDGRRLSIST